MSSGMENAQNFAAVISSMVLGPSFFDYFSMFSQFLVFSQILGCRGGGLFFSQTPNTLQYLGEPPWGVPPQGGGSPPLGPAGCYLGIPRFQRVAT